MYFDRIVQLLPPTPSVPTRHFLDSCTQRVCAGTGGVWQNIKTFEGFIKTGLTFKNNSSSKDTIKEIFTYAPHLLAVVAPVYFNESAWSTLVINTSAVLLNHLIESWGVYQDRKAGNLLKNIMAWYSAERTIEVHKKQTGLSSPLSFKEVRNILNDFFRDLKNYLPEDKLKTLKVEMKDSYRGWYVFDERNQNIFMMEIESADDIFTVMLYDKHSTWNESVKYFLAHTVLPALIPILQFVSEKYLTTLPLPFAANFGLALLDLYNKKEQKRLERDKTTLSNEEITQEVLRLFSQARREFERALAEQYV
jgi:hypothetical protein